jgi:sec-independent protein translocase protein TatA
MFDISAVQIIIVLVIALVVFGPKRLPELGRQLGKGLREMKGQVSAFSDELRDSPGETARIEPEPPRPTPAAAITEVDEDDLLDGVVVSGASAPETPAPRPADAT